MLDSSETLDIPSLVVAEATGRRIRVETIEGGSFTGNLVHFDDHSGNVEMADVKGQARDSTLSIYERFLVKGDQVRMIHLPLELKKAPMLEWRSENVQQALKKALKPKKRTVKRAPKREVQTEKRKQETKLRKLK